MLPVPRPPSAVRHGNDLQEITRDPVDERERVVPEDYAARAVQVARPPLRALEGEFNGPIELIQKGAARDRPSIQTALRDYRGP